MFNLVSIFLKDAVVGNMERFFYWYGKTIAKYPAVFIGLSIMIVGLSSLGLMKLRMENNGIKLWIPEDSSQRINTDWLWANFPPETRFASMIFVADNILDPDVIRAMYTVRKGIDNIVTEDGDTWKDMCMSAPIVKPPDLSSIFDFGRRKKRRKKRQSSDFDDFSDFSKDEDDFFAEVEAEQDPFGLRDDRANDKSAGAEYFSVAYYPEPYCDIVEKLDYACLEMSILELWANDGSYDAETDRQMAKLTLEDVLDRINNRNKSGVFLIEKNFTSMLSNIRRDSVSGKIIGAEAAVMRWLARMNTTNALHNPAKGRGEPIDTRTLTFEGDMLKIMLNTTEYPEGLKSHPHVKRSFGDIAGSTILGDVSVMVIGYMIVFFYVIIMLGKFNSIEQRAYLSMAGMNGVIMGIIVSYGLCSACGLFFGPMHSVLPFLLLGIGIDDMFVIVQCWDTLDKRRKAKPSSHLNDLSLPERFGETLSHAGVAITITSVTDIIAFGVGGTTVLPALKSFCIYASVGIVATYWFQVTFFVAWMSLDVRRSEDNRNACCPCFKHSEDFKTNKCSQTSICQTIFVGLGKLLTKWPVKVLVILVTAGVTGVGIWGNILLRQEFDPTWFLPPETYLSQWFKANAKYFPFGGDRVTIYCSSVDYINEFDKLDQLAKDLSNQTDIVDQVDSWTTDFRRYLEDNFNGEQVSGLVLNVTKFNERLAQYFFSPLGGQYRFKFKFKDDMECGEAAPDMLLSQITFVHRIFSGPEEHVPAMNRVKDLIASANLSGRVFPISIGYASWETDEVISHELYRNIVLAIICVFITTLFLLANLSASLLVLLCVVLSLVDVGGFMHFWGLTIDTVSCNNLIIAIGLCVDYSAHIAHRLLLIIITRGSASQIKTLTTFSKK
jgi:Niemann-Pick C1 protein